MYSNTSMFTDFTLDPSILRALADEGYTEPTPVQSDSIPDILAGRDVLATAQTGTGKTAAFSLPILHRLHSANGNGKRDIRALVVTPTRELALQVEESMRTYGRHLRLRTAVLLGGISQVPQVKALRRNPDILVATPGRLLDLMQQGFVRLGGVETLVLDEADRMLDMGFVKDVRRIVSTTPKTRQTLLFSATMSRDIAALAGEMLRDPIRVAVAPEASVADNISQRVLFVEQGDKRNLLSDILSAAGVERALVFTRTKHRAERISQQLSRGGISADSIHSNKSQNARQRTLTAFHRGAVKVLVATDIVARGIDVEGITHVINYELPNDPENYVHRIGRTARAGAAGVALSFCGADEVPALKGIEKLTQCRIKPDLEHRYHSDTIANLGERSGRVIVPSHKPRSERTFGRKKNRTDRPRKARR